MHARIQIYWCRSSIFRHLKLELLTQFPASNDEKYINVVYIWREFVSFYGYAHWRMTTEISVMYGSEKVNVIYWEIILANIWLKPLTSGAEYIGFFTQLLPHSVPPFMHVKAILWHQSARFEKTWPLFCKIWIIEIVDRVSETQVQVDENSNWIIWVNRLVVPIGSRIFLAKAYVNFGYRYFF